MRYDPYMAVRRQRVKQGIIIWRACYEFIFILYILRYFGRHKAIHRGISSDVCTTCYAVPKILRLQTGIHW